MPEKKKENSFSNGLFFSGEYEHSLDSQRRIAIPKPWRRKNEGTGFFLVPGRHRTLQLIPFESFQDFLMKARKIPFADPKASLALARFGSRAQECQCDKQGRIPIPQRLIDYAGFREQVVLIGAVSVIQIWNPDEWRKMQVADESYLDEVQKIGEAQTGLVSFLKSE